MWLRQDPQLRVSHLATTIRNNMGLWIAGDNLVQWRFDNVEINYLKLSLTAILKLNFVANFLLREKFETTLSLPKQQKMIRLNFYINQMCDVTFSPKSWGNCYVTVHDYGRRFADPYYFEFGSGTQIRKTLEKSNFLPLNSGRSSGYIAHARCPGDRLLLWN